MELGSGASLPREVHHEWRIRDHRKNFGTCVSAGSIRRKLSAALPRQLEVSRLSGDYLARPSAETPVRTRARRLAHTCAAAHSRGHGDQVHCGPRETVGRGRDDGLPRHIPHRTTADGGTGSSAASQLHEDDAVTGPHESTRAQSCARVRYGRHRDQPAVSLRGWGSLRVKA